MVKLHKKFSVEKNLQKLFNKIFRIYQGLIILSNSNIIKNLQNSLYWISEGKSFIIEWKLLKIF